ERARKWARRKPAAAALLLVSCLASLLLVAGLGVGLLLLAEKQEETEDAYRESEKVYRGERQVRGQLEGTLADLRAEQGKTGELLRQTTELLGAKSQALRDLDNSLHFNRIALAHSERAANNLAGAEQALGQCKPELRGWEWHYLKRLCEGSLLTLRGHTD